MRYTEATNLFIQSSWFTTLASKTQADYLYYMDYMRDLLPNTISKVTPLLADNIYSKVKKQRGERTAIYVCSVMRRLWNFLYRAEKVKSLPWSNMGIKQDLKPRTVKWMPEDVKKIIQQAMQDGHISLALFVALLYDTAQRPSDILSLTWDNILDDEFLTLTQSKTGAIITVPLRETSKKLLEKQKKNIKWVIPTKTGCKYHLTNMNKEFNMVKKSAGVSSELQLRDLRRTALTELGDAGATEDEIMAVSGHKSRQVLSVYVKKTEQQAINAMAKRGDL